MDEPDGRPGHVALQFGHLSAASDAPEESLSPALYQALPAHPAQITGTPAFAAIGLRLYGADWAHLMLHSNGARGLHAPPLRPLPVRPKEVCFGARSAAPVTTPLPLPAGLCPLPGEHASLHIAYPASLLRPREDHAPAVFVSTQSVTEEDANENVPGK